MTALVTEPNLAAPDDFYEALIAMHRGSTTRRARACNARLILLLANHIGDPEVLATGDGGGARGPRGTGGIIDRAPRGHPRESGDPATLTLNS